MTRYPDWVSRLESFLAKNAKRKFRYGSWDCCLFAAHAVEAMTGVDTAADFLDKYDSAVTAKKVIREFSNGALLGRVVERVAARFQMPEIDRTRAHRGDLALLKRGGGDSVGIVALDGLNLIVPGSDGLLRVPIVLAKRVWEV